MCQVNLMQQIDSKNLIACISVQDFGEKFLFLFLMHKSYSNACIIMLFLV